MAEATLFSLAGKLLAELASPPFKKAYQQLQSIRKANEDLDKLTHTIRIIQAVLVDAEKKHQESAAVREWIERVRDVLYDADDLFDAVVADALLKQQQPHKDTLISKVQASFSTKFSAFISDDNTAKQVKAIRKRLDEILTDMAHFQFIQSRCENQKNSARSRAETSPFVDVKLVIGREEEKQTILEFLFDKSDVEKSVSVIAIVGIGGMGKTTLAQLVYNHEEVRNNFGNKWWACISDIVGETNVLERIARAIDEESCQHSDPKELINKTISNGGRYLLVLDDVWDNDLGIWFDIMSLLSSGAKGSKIVVTTRFLSVPRALKKDKCQIHELHEFSESASWELFTRIAFTEEQENDPKWTSLGREIMRKCGNVPLAIRSIASLLLEKDTIQEWESFKNQELSKIERSGDSIMSTLKLSYDHLPSHLKHCFAYCSLFPQDFMYNKEDLVCQWIAQGYVKPNDNETLEEAGHAYFMELWRKSFFQGFKMHDLIHDLSKDVAGTENLTLITRIHPLHKNTRHLFLVGGQEDVCQIIQDSNRLRSCVVRCVQQVIPLALEPWLTKCKLLRTLNLRWQEIENVPSSIGDLKHLRYLDLSGNIFSSLPDSLSKLVNLITLKLTECSKLEALPNDFRKLINLRHLYNADCGVRHMPPGLGELTCLKILSCAYVGRKSGSGNRLEFLGGSRLEGELEIQFDREIDDWDEDDYWQLPMTLHRLVIRNYPGRRIPHWERGTGQTMADNVSCNLLPNLVNINLCTSSTIKHLPPFRHLPYLKVLGLDRLYELEYVEEEDEDENDGQSDSSTGLYFPCLEILILDQLRKLKGWSRKLEGDVDPYYLFPPLWCLTIEDVSGLKSMPLCPRVKRLQVKGIKEELMQQLMSATSTMSHFLVELEIIRCDWLKSFSGETFHSLQRLILENCHNLKNLCVMPMHLEWLDIMGCRGLELWDEDVHKRGVDWDSLPNLCRLQLYGMGHPRKLPHSLQQLQYLGQLQIDYNPYSMPHISDQALNLLFK